MSRKKLSASLILISLAYLSCLSACNPRDTPIFRKLAKESDERIAKQTERDLKESPVLQEIDRLCTQQIPLFDGFKLTRRMSWQSRNPFLSYSYSSAADYRSVRSFYKDYFNRNAWQMTKDQDGGWGPPWEARFKNNDYSISITYFGSGEESNYSVFCQKLLYPDEAL
jgi:hypothetical protein